MRDAVGREGLAGAGLSEKKLKRVRQRGTQFSDLACHWALRIVLRLGLPIGGPEVVRAGLARDPEDGVRIEHLFRFLGNDGGLALLMNLLSLPLARVLFSLTRFLLFLQARFLFLTRFLLALFRFVLTQTKLFFLLRPLLIRPLRGGAP